MSFGFSVGDFIAVIELANKIRKDFVDAPSQFKAISDEVRSLSIVLLDVEVLLSDRELRNEQEVELKQIANGCSNVLNELEHTLDEYKELKSSHVSVSKRIKRAWKRLKWEPEEIKQLRSRISTNIGLLNAFTCRLTRDNVVTLVRNQEDQGRQTILDWITPIDYAPQQSDFISRRQAGTGQWLLDSTEFKAWVDTDRQILFCPGIPGAGKTILTSIVVEELMMRFENDGNIGIAYLYCNYRQQYEQKLEDLFTSLLKQFVQEQPSIPDSVKTLYDRHKDKRTRPSLDETLGILQSAAAAYSRVFIIVDALDECQISDGCRQRFLSGLFKLHAKCRVNLFVTSRPILNIEKEFEGNTVLEIRASEEDVRRYLEGYIFRLPGFVVRSLELQEEIKADIVKAVNGMFLLAQLHLESLTGKRSPKAVRTALKNLATGPGAYDYAYEDTMERINGQAKDQEELAKQVLWWITCAKRPLTTSELQHALAVEIGQSQLDNDNLSQVEDIVSVCAGLITVDKKSNIIRLVHYTTQEYFERTQERWFPEAERDIAETCITYLSFNAFNSGACTTDEGFQVRLDEYVLYDYAAQHWAHHARIASTVAKQLVMGFLESEAKVLASNQAMMDTGNCLQLPRSMTELHLATYFGLEDIVNTLLKAGNVRVNSMDEYGRTPLSWAAEDGHEAIVRLLLAENGVNVDLKDVDRRSPLSYAAGSGHDEVVKILIENSASAHSVDNDRCTPLIYAAWWGFEEVVKILLDQDDVRVDWKNDWKETALHRAVSFGQEHIVALLLGCSNPNRKDCNGNSPLSHAVFCSDRKIVGLLLGAKDTLVDSKNKLGQTPLIQAARNGDIEMLKLLLERGAQINARDKERRTPLSHAAEWGRAGAVKWILAQDGVDVDAFDRRLRTSWLYAKQNGHDETVKSLEDAGAFGDFLEVFRMLRVK